MMTNGLRILQKDWYYIRPFWIRNLGPTNGIIGQIEPLRRTQINHTQGLKYIRPFGIRNLGPRFKLIGQIDSSP